MSDIAIHAEGLGKMYRIGGPKQKYRTIRETIVDTAKMPFQRARSVIRGEAAGGGRESFWALNDISFEVKQGEVVGIIGHNGAGKSTLLKILSRITEPSAGYVDVYGRVGSLLEVGTGFHPELTGRENIYLNGAILGMTREEINRKFDEIVDFAEVEKFIDTPVKHYSSGMGLRLGFAVAAYLEPEILVVDEVLAVGDMNFQKKCLGKMGDVANQGRTVLFVSHNLSAVATLCTKGILLKSGQIVLQGTASDAISHYQANVNEITSISLSERTDRRRGSRKVKLDKLYFLDKDGGLVNSVSAGEQISVVVESTSEDNASVKNVTLDAIVKDMLGNFLFVCSTKFSKNDFSQIYPVSRFVCTLPGLPLIAGTYRLDVWLGVEGRTSDYITDAGQFIVQDTDYFGTGNLPKYSNHGSFLINQDWELKQI